MQMANHSAPQEAHWLQIFWQLEKGNHPIRPTLTTPSEKVEDVLTRALMEFHTLGYIDSPESFSAPSQLSNFWNLSVLDDGLQRTLKLDQTLEAQGVTEGSKIFIQALSRPALAQHVDPELPVLKEGSNLLVFALVFCILLLVGAIVFVALSGPAKKPAKRGNTPTKNLTLPTDTEIPSFSTEKLTASKDAGAAEKAAEVLPEEAPPEKEALPEPAPPKKRKVVKKKRKKRKLIKRKRKRRKKVRRRRSKRRVKKKRKATKRKRKRRKKVRRRPTKRR
ncbi:MAG TPA: hypothetical protein DCE42_05170 [Myxococcales bacterium]|nr:hypothetical protein [Deltaproteobacteria bacterium]HAA54122.1 hypothetical protein [Myxococcales bacterium]